MQYDFLNFFLSVLTHSLPVASCVVACPRLSIFVCVLTCFLVFIEPKPVYAQPGQPDVDLPVSPADAPVPSVTHDDSILRYPFFLFIIMHRIE